MKSNIEHNQKDLQQVSAICKDLDRWPESWAGGKEDIAVGEQLLGVFTVYLIQLINKGRTKATIRKHADYLWALGGEIIRDMSEDDTSGSMPDGDLVLKYIDSEGGPYWRHASNDNYHQQFDSVCRQLYKYLTLVKG